MWAKRLRHVLVALLGVIASLGAAAPGPALAADRLTVILDWFVNPDHAPLIVAKEAGFFAREGLDVELIAPADPSTPPRLVGAGKADIAVTYQADLLLDVQAGLPLVRIGTLVETPLNCLIALRSGPIKTLADLKGKRIGFSIANLQEVYLGAMLATVGLSIRDVTLVGVNFNLANALKAGSVDAIIDGFRTFELIEMELEGFAATAFYPEEHGVPAYDELVYVTRSELRRDARIARFVAAVEKATLFLTNHPDEALALVVKAYPDLDDTLNRRAFAATLPRFAKRPGALDRARYDRFALFLTARGLLDRAPALESYAIEPQ